jgi:Mg2+/Co2+ transporter CorB
MPLHIMLIALVFLLVLSGFFSLSETSMMAINRYRLRHLAKQGHRGARLTIKLLDHTDRLLGVILARQQFTEHRFRNFGRHYCCDSVCSR